MIESPALSPEVADLPVFHPQPVAADEAFVRGGRGRLRTLVVCAAPLGDGMPLDLRREWTLLKTHAEESRVPVTLFRLLPPTVQKFRRALERCAERGLPRAACPRRSLPTSCTLPATANRGT